MKEHLNPLALLHALAYLSWAFSFNRS